MKVTLAPRQRALLLFLSASGYTAWFSGLGDRTSAEELGAVPEPFVTVDVRPDLPLVASLIVRDPFAGKPPTGGAQTITERPLVSEIAGSHRELAVANVSGGNDAVVVPDIANAGAAPAAALTLVLRATIVGPNPVAYVANGTAMDIVRVGDSLGERRVAKIDLRGIAFDDGTRLDLPVTYLATPRPARKRAASDDRVTLETLRRLLLPAREQQANDARATEPQATPQATPQPAPTPAFPTPGPLATVNMQGLPVGVNPTPDANGPTPYPNPYPYAPPAHH